MTDNLSFNLFCKWIENGSRKVGGKEDGGADDFIFRDRNREAARSTSSSTSNKQQETTRHVRGSDLDPGTRKQISLSTRQKTKPNPPVDVEKNLSSVADNAVSGQKSSNESTKNKRTTSTTTTLESTPLSGGNNFGGEEKVTSRSEGAGNSQSSVGSSSVAHSLSSMVTNAMTPDRPTIFVNLTLGTIIWLLPIFFKLLYKYKLFLK